MANKEDTIKIVDGRLIVDVALDGTKISKSGLSKMLFSTNGNIEVNGVKLGINAYVRA